MEKERSSGVLNKTFLFCVVNQADPSVTPKSLPTPRAIPYGCGAISPSRSLLLFSVVSITLPRKIYAPKVSSLSFGKKPSTTKGLGAVFYAQTSRKRGIAKNGNKL